MKGQFFPFRDENISRSRPYVTLGIIAANVLLFFVSLSDFRFFIQTFGFIPAQPSLLNIFSSMFLHSSLGHLIGNLWFLYIFGDNVEDVYGRVKYLLFYLTSGVVALSLHWLTTAFTGGAAIPTIGASGAISGVVGAYLVLFPSTKVKTVGPFYMIYNIPASVLIGFWFLMQLFFGALNLVSGGSGIAFWAHIGGFAFGYLLTRMVYGTEKREIRFEF